jgi:S-formylglutathione hydrolase FrmB
MRRETDIAPGSGSETRRPVRWAAAGVAALGTAIAVVGVTTAGSGASAVSAASATTSAVTPTSAAADPANIPHGTVETIDLPSGDADGKTRAVWIYRPPVADSAQLPVVYFLHGYPGTQNDLAGAGFPALLDAAFAAGAAPFVVVAPNGQSDIHPDTEWADSVDGKVRLESFIIDTVIPAVEGTHPRDRAHRAIAGHSMGGYGAMNLGLRHPDLFGQIASSAGYYHIDDPDKMGGGTAAWAAANSPDRHVVAGATSRVLLITDAQEHDPLIQGEAQRYLDLAQAAGQHPTFVVAPGGHTWAMVASQIPAIVNFLDAGW